MKRELILAAILILAALPVQAQTFTPIRVHCGGSAYTDSNGNVWQADNGFSGGLAYWQAATVSGTPDPALFESIRYAPQGQSFTYTFAVPNGAYTVNLSFAELWNSPRSESVLIDGATVLDHWNVFAVAGNDVASIQHFPVTVTTGSITIELDSYGTNGYLDAIEILSAAPPAPLQFPFPGCCTITFPIQNASQVPVCTAADGVCSIAIQICDTANPPNCLTSNVGTLSLVKTSSLPAPQVLTVPVAIATNP